MLQKFCGMTLLKCRNALSSSNQLQLTEIMARQTGLLRNVHYLQTRYDFYLHFSENDSPLRCTQHENFTSYFLSLFMHFCIIFVTHYWHCQQCDCQIYGIDDVKCMFVTDDVSHQVKGDAVVPYSACPFCQTFLASYYMNESPNNYVTVGHV